MPSRIACSLAVAGSLLSLPLVARAEVTDEFLPQHRVEYSTKEHPKAKGVSLTIAYPDSWVAAEGNQPHVVQRFTSRGGSILRMIEVIVDEVPGLPTDYRISETEARELFASPAFLQSAPKGAALIRAEPTQIAGLPAAIREFSSQEEKVGILMYTRFLNVNFFYDNKTVVIQFGVAGRATETETVDAAMTASMPLFLQVANTVVFPDR